MKNIASTLLGLGFFFNAGIMNAQDIPSRIQDLNRYEVVHNKIYDEKTNSGFLIYQKVTPLGTHREITKFIKCGREEAPIFIYNEETGRLVADYKAHDKDGNFSFYEPDGKIDFDKVLNDKEIRMIGKHGINSLNFPKTECPKYV